MKKLAKNFSILVVKNARGQILSNTEVFISSPVSVFPAYLFPHSIPSVLGSFVGKYKTNNEGRIFLSDFQTK